MKRRAFVVGGLIVLAACKREARCRHCGMKLSPSSTWYAELTGDGAPVSFDTPRCALSSWRSGETRATGMRVREYYDAAGPLRDARGLRFVIGGDVSGPMGPDLVPVDPSRATKFIQDHGADRALPLDDVTSQVLAALK